MSKRNRDKKRYEVITQEDDNGDLLIPLPPALLTELNWKPDDEIELTVDKNGKFILKRVDR